MTEPTSFERRVADWLIADAPGTAPADVLETVLERVAERAQERHASQRWFGERLGRSPVLRWAIVLVLVATALAGAIALVGDRFLAPRPPGIGAFRPGPELAIGRGAHTATRLSDGRVLVLGGQTHPDGWVPAADTTEIWDPSSGDVGTFTRGGALLEPRSRHTATLLPDGRVLVVGGQWWDGTGLFVRDSAEIWDPATGSSSAAGILAAGRYDHSAAVLPDGRVLIAGGMGGVDPAMRPITTLEVWDPATATFAPAGTLRLEHPDSTALLLADGRVLLVGWTGTEVWDPATGEIAVGPSLVEPRYFPTATLTGSGQVLVSGGMWGTNDDIGTRASAEIWDPASSAFVLLDARPLRRASHTATLLPDGRILIAGGDDARTAEVWDPQTGAFAATGPTIEPRSMATATLLEDGRVLLVGAMSRRGIPPMTEIWDATAQPVPSTGTPTPELPSTPEPRPASEPEPALEPEPAATVEP